VNVAPSEPRDQATRVGAARDRWAKNQRRFLDAWDRGAL